MSAAPTIEQLTAAASRFWMKVEKHDPDCVCCEGCWRWTAGRDPWGYGQFKIAGESRRAHVVAWALMHGRWPDRTTFPKEIIRHTCDRPACVNPKHLVLGTYTDNMRDRADRGRNRHAIWPSLRAERQGGRTHG